MAENPIEEIIRKYISELKLSGFPVEKLFYSAHAVKVIATPVVI